MAHVDCTPATKRICSGYSEKTGKLFLFLVMITLHVSSCNLSTGTVRRTGVGGYSTQDHDVLSTSDTETSVPSATARVILKRTGSMGLDKLLFQLLQLNNCSRIHT